MTAVRVEIKSSETTERSFVDKKGQNRKLRLQEAYAFLNGAYPERIELALWEDQQPYSPGFYGVSLKSFQVSAYRNLELKRSLELEKLPTPTSKA